MRVMRRICAPALAAGAALALSGCLVSDKPLLDARTGHARPIGDGDYSACEYDNDDAPDCKTIHIARDQSGVYSLLPEDEDEPTLVRFRRLAAGAWTAQLWGAGDDSFYYFLAETNGDEFVMAMINCGDIAKSLRDKYVARGEMTVDEDESVCTAKTLGAVMASARAFRDDAPISTRARIVYKRLADTE